MLGGGAHGGNNAAQMQAIQQALGGLGGLGGAMPNAGGRRQIQIGGAGGMGNLLGALLAMQGGAIQLGGRGGHGFDVPNPQAAGVGDLSTNLLDSFGARLSEAADGVRVLDVKAGTPASNAGLKVGDLITQLNGRQVATGENVREIYGTLAAGDKVEIEVSRGGEAVTLTTRK
jgi:S1-C subfamily serine protease